MNSAIDISVIIVNYNVKYFLEQCLRSVYDAKQGLNVDVWVVDNNSVDGSMALVKEEFPTVKCIENKKNVGFSVANNQAMMQAQGKYQLILNPDTVVEKDTLKLCFEYMENNEDAGALGVRMIDGKGQFLPESKRGLPTPHVALYKMTLLNKFFPKSKTFGKYHMGFLPEDAINEVDILSGAFMFIRTAVLRKIGYFDQSFFMYGEDIDLSYRIKKAGYKNIYFPKSTIIHYKGESTKKKTVNYVITFYNAMIIFAKKHYKGSYKNGMVAFVKIAIWARAAVALVQRLLEKLWVPFLDFTLLFLGFFFLAKYWEIYNRFVPQYYPDIYYTAHLPTYIFLILMAVKLSGGYAFPYKMYRSQRGVLMGALVLMAAYGLLPKEWQFSRAIVLLGSLWSLIAISISRWLAHYLKTNSWELDISENQRVAVVADHEEYLRVSNLINNMGKQGKLIGQITPNDAVNVTNALGNVSQLEEIIEIYRINELIFCAKNVASNTIIGIMSNLSTKKIKFRMVPEGVNYMVGSHSKNSPGELFSIDVKLALGDENNQLKKRFLDVIFAFIYLLFLPITLLKPSRIPIVLKNIARLMIGKITTVSYFPAGNVSTLPKLKKGLLFPSNLINSETDIQTVERVNFLYAKDYKPGFDIELFLKNISALLFKI